MNNIEERLLDAGFEGVIYLDEIYDDAFVGIDNNYRSIYDYEKMIMCLMKEGATVEEAMDDIDYNVIGSLPSSDTECYAPIIMYSVEWMGI